MNTSHFGAWRGRSDDPRLVAICRRPPAWWSSWTRNRRWYRDLAPSKEILGSYRSGYWSWAVYCAEYQASVLARLDPARVYADLGPDAILLCWEKAPEHCHRSLVTAWLRDAGIECSEMGTVIR